MSMWYPIARGPYVLAHPREGGLFVGPFHDSIKTSHIKHLRPSCLHSAGSNCPKQLGDPQSGGFPLASLKIPPQAVCFASNPTQNSPKQPPPHPAKDQDMGFATFASGRWRLESGEPGPRPTCLVLDILPFAQE